MPSTGTPRRVEQQHPRIPGLWGGLAGAMVGFAVASVIYLLVNPVLESSSGWVRELQGLLWNLVPLFTAGGAAVGWWVVTRRR